MDDVVERTDDPMILASARPRAASAPPAGTAARATVDEVFALVYRQVRILAGPRDVEDLAQAAAEQVLRSLRSFEGRSQLSTWTYRVCYLTIQKHDRWYRRWLRRFTLTDDGEMPEQPDDEARGEDALERSERLRRLRAAKEKLSSKRRAVLILHDIEGLPVEEIARVVGASVAAVRSRLRDGRRQLARTLFDDPWFGDDACAKEKGR
jgi:RNA polymerase sigma-70 factor, ECF subfamily